MTKGWAFRVASTAEVGAGHIRRSSALALELSRRRPVTMYLDPGSDHWMTELRARGLDVGVAKQAPAKRWEGVVLDGYDFTSSEIKAWRETTDQLVVLDDIEDPPPEATVVVNAAPHLSGTKMRGKPALLGPRYALLSNEFKDLSPPPIRNSIMKVLVTFGMIDSRNATELTLFAAQVTEALADATVVVVTSERATHVSNVKRQVNAAGPRYRLRLDIDDMAEELISSDIAIGAGGVSLLERMASGTPSITITTAGNQTRYVEGAAALGATVSAGFVDDLDIEDLARTIERLAVDRYERLKMSSQGQDVVDGRGAERLASELLSGVTLDA